MLKGGISDVYFKPQDGIPSQAPEKEEKKREKCKKRKN